jgi:hypothetical protein
VPLCFGSILKGGLPAPFSERQALGASDPNDLQTLFNEIARLAGGNFREVDLEPLSRQLDELERRVAASTSTDGSHREETYKTREGRIWRRSEIDELPEAELSKLLEEKPDLGDWWLGKPI